MTTTTVTPKAAPMSSNQDRFFRFFQHEVTALQERMQLLESHGTSGGERNDAVDFCLTGISKLTNEVKDASSYLPAYDQRTYGEAIKALSEKLQKIRLSFAPRQKFSFKSGFPRKNASAISISDAAELASKQHLFAPAVSSGESSFAPTPLESPAPESVSFTIDNQQPTSNSSNGVPTAPAPAPSPSTTKHQTSSKPSSSSDTVSISSHTNKHIILPATTAHATASATLSNLTSSIVDLSLASSNSTTTSSSPDSSTPKIAATTKPFAALYLKNIQSSLLICGHVDGAIHITNLQNSVLVVTTRQFRMHESKNCKIYLCCRSRPIIEDCVGLDFTWLPEKYRMEEGVGRFENLYDQVDDFKWLKAEKSPNWRVLDEKERIDESVWRDVVCGRPGSGVEDILKAVGVTGA